uniref:TOG domain-containing protein n=1 Tax=Trichobilharzia regenti TaxID=157069 RepID=A0AA85JIV8_TRIRE|nr:unnamed protein product [Trichobilharzia regenti]
MPREICKLDENSLSKLESKSWQERRDALELISNQLKVSTLPSGLVSQVTKGLCQVISSDKHSMLVIRAAGVLRELVESVGSGFMSHAERALTVCLLKFKDNKAHLSETLRSATEAIVDMMPFDIALRQLQTALTTPVAKTQAETLNLLTHLFRTSKRKYELQLNQRLKIVKPILSNTAKFSEHKSQECRDACFQMFASICIFLDFTSQQFSSIIDNILDESRRSKLDIALLHLRESISTENIDNEHRNSEKANKTVKPKSSSTEQQQKRRQQQQQQLVDNPDFSITPIKSSPRIVMNKLSKRNKQLRTFQTQNHLSTSTPFSEVRKVLTPSITEVSMSLQRAGAKQPSAVVTKKAVNSRRVVQSKAEKCIPQDLNLSSGQLRCKLSEGYLEDVPLEQLLSPTWKIRLQVAERIHSMINSKPPGFPDVHYLLQYILNCGTVKDSIFRVRCEVINILSQLLSKNKSQNWIPAQLLEMLCDQLFVSIGDSKSGPLVEQTLRHLMDTIGVSKIVECINKGLKKQVSPTVCCSLLKWLSSVLKSLDCSFDHVLPIEIVKFGLASSSPNVRNIAVELAGVIHYRLRSSMNILSLFASEKPAILQRLQAEFATYDVEEEESVASPEHIKNDGSTFSGMECLTPAAVTAWSKRQKRLTAVLDVAPLDRLIGAQGVLEFSDSSESPFTGRKSSPYKKGVIEAVVRQPLQAVHVNSNQPPSTTQPTSLPDCDTIFFIESNDETSLLQAKEMRLASLKKRINRSSDELRDFFTECHTHPIVMKQLFSESYECYLEVLDRLMASLDDKNENVQTKQPSALIITYAHFDLLLMWIVQYCLGLWLKESIRKCEYQNVKDILTRAFDYLTAVLTLFAQNDLRLSEYEVNIILIPLLKCELQAMFVYRDSFINNIATGLVRLIRQVYPASLLIDILVKYMHECGNAKMRQICLDELVCLIPRFSDPKGLTSGYALKSISHQLADSDAGVKKSALDCLQAAYKSFGALFWQHIGNIGEEDKKLLEEYLSCEAEGNTAALPTDNFDTLSAKTPFGSIITKDSTVNVHHTLDFNHIRRAVSPPPVHMSPAEPTHLLRLVNKRDDPSSTESERIEASNALDAALLCLVGQLGCSVCEDAEDEVENIATVGDRGTIIFSDKNDDDFSGLNNILLGALIDLEVLIQDSRTCDLLPPYMPDIITQLTLLCNRLFISEVNAGQAIFMDCLGGELTCIFSQPFLFREVNADHLKFLLGSLIELAERLQLNREAPRLCTNRRVLLILKLVRFIYTAVDPSICLSALLRLVHICCFGCDIRNRENKPIHKNNKDNAEDKSSKFPQQLREPYSVDLGPNSFATVAKLSLAQLSCRISEIRQYLNKIDWALILPLLEAFLPNSSGVQKPVKIRSNRSVCVEILGKTVNAIDDMLVEVYACRGQAFIDEIEKSNVKCPSVLRVVEKLKSIMREAPYPHCPGGSTTGANQFLL